MRDGSCDGHYIDKRFSYRQVARLNTCDANDADSVDDLTSKALMPLEDTVKHFESLFLKPVSTEEEASIPYVRLFPYLSVFFFSHKWMLMDKLYRTRIRRRMTLCKLLHHTSTHFSRRLPSTQNYRYEVDGDI